MPNNSSTFILIANYLPDEQKSMLLFSNMLAKGLNDNNHNVIVLHPVVFFGLIFKKVPFSFRKWVEYIDKFILFPMLLIFKRYYFYFKFTNYKFHICDHSNSFYIFFLPKKISSITCHDVLAIRGSLGFKDAYCTYGFTGKILQKIIFYSLNKFQKIIFVSKFTQNQYIELKNILNFNTKQKFHIIYNTFNYGYKKLHPDDLNSLSKNYLPEILINKQFILHVGSSLPRKNKDLLIKLLNSLQNNWDGILCLAGTNNNESTIELIQNFNLKHKVIFIENPTSIVLEVLYNKCFVFIFPSFSEGFGWPLIEAQSVGCPVITSNLDPMLEITNGSALYANPNDEKSFENKFYQILDESKRNTLIELGYKNIKRFNKENIINNYISLLNA
jgi:glycosyltransferase involved in cell wall biosynthesis